MQTITKSILRRINRPRPESHKGDNGRLLMIAGSRKFHGAVLMAARAASYLVDVIYIYSTKENFQLIQGLKERMASFISVFPKELDDTARKSDAILIGPGLEELKQNIKLTERLLKKYPDKKTIIDATALWHLNLNWLHGNCILTPHAKEFVNAFHCEPNAENTLKMAKKHGVVIVLKGHVDYVSDGKELWQNKTGNAGMTKGGTGDVLAGMVAGLATTNDPLAAALAGIFLNGYAGDQLHNEYGTFYNSEDLAKAVSKVWKENCC